MLALAVALAGVSVVLARNWLESQVRQRIIEIPAEPRIRLARVVVAATPVASGTEIRREHLREVAWPASARPPGAFGALDEIVGSEDEPRIALRSIGTNEPVLKEKISGFGGHAGLSQKLSPEMRAIAIRVNDVNGVAGFVFPGDRVDILFTRKANRGTGGDRGDLVTDILLEGVRVLAVDQDTEADRGAPKAARTATVEVTPFQAQKLTLAQRLGHLSLALRHTTSARTGTPRTVGRRDLNGAGAIPSAGDGSKPRRQSGVGETTSKPRAEKLSVRVIRGVTVSSYAVFPERPSPSATASGRGTVERRPRASQEIPGLFGLLKSTAKGRAGWKSVPE